MFIKVETENQIDNLVVMAKDIWGGYFKTFFDNVTLSKLIEAAQSKNVILDQIENGFEYYFIVENNETRGYFAYEIDSANNSLFLQKLYLFPEHRRKGLGKSVLDHLESLCAQKNLNKLELTVYHRNDNAIRAYEKWGFENLGLIERDFGNTLVFKDCKMEKSV